MRLFVAIELDDDVRAALVRIQDKLGRRCNGVRWIPASQIHLTMRFLGDVPDVGVPQVSQAVAAGACSVQPFDFEVVGCGCFPPGGRPVRIVWAGVREPTGALDACVAAVEAQLERAGHPRERRPFSPHITIGRVREDRSGGTIREAVEAVELKPRAQSIRSLTVMQSVLSPAGPTYTPVSKAALGGSREPDSGEV